MSQLRLLLTCISFHIRWLGASCSALIQGNRRNWPWTSAHSVSCRPSQVCAINGSIQGWYFGLKTDIPLMKRIHKNNGLLCSSGSGLILQSSLMSCLRLSERSGQLGPSRVYSGNNVVMNDNIERFVTSAQTPPILGLMGDCLECGIFTRR